jgi:hypothetical protein
MQKKPSEPIKVDLAKLLAAESRLRGRQRYGVRITDHGRRGVLLRASNEWDDGYRTKRKLPGTSVISLGFAVTDSDPFGPYKRFGVPWLVRGTFVEDGNDPGEIILSGARFIRPLKLSN